MSSLHRRRQKQRISNLHRKKERRGRTGAKGKGRAWNSKHSNKKRNIRGKEKVMAHKIKKANK